MTAATIFCRVYPELIEEPKMTMWSFRLKTSWHTLPVDFVTIEKRFQLTCGEIVVMEVGWIK